MKKIEELYAISKKVVDGFFTKSASLNEGIISEVKNNNLNEEEIKRISELSNTRVYLEMRKSAEANYVKFDVADPEVIIKEAGISTIQPYVPVQPSYHEDYSKAPVITKAAEFEKEASIEKEAAEVEYQIPHYEKELLSLKDNIQMQSMVFDERVEKLSKQVRQLILQGAPLDNVKTLFQYVDKSEVVWNAVSDRLEKEFPMIKQSSAVEDVVVNDSNSIVTETRELIKIAKSIATNAIIYDNLHGAITKEASIAFEKLKKPGKRIALAALIGTAYLSGKKSAEFDKRIRELNSRNTQSPRGPLQ